MPRPFLTARWCNLILANYAVPEDVLRRRLPPGLEPDVRDGRCWASLVGFQFLDTRVLGVPWPGFRHFPEWNLRFYVRHDAELTARYGACRGVCFVREFVPQRLVAWVARALYNEPYHAVPITMAVADEPDRVTAAYTVTAGGRTHRLAAVGDKPAVRPGPDTAEHWLKEHAWGYGVTRRGRLLRYEVTHPEWDTYPVRSFDADVDWSALYGPEWGGMNGAAPDSVVLAAGSAVKVFPHGTVGPPA